MRWAIDRASVSRAAICDVFEDDGRRLSRNHVPGFFQRRDYGLSILARGVADRSPVQLMIPQRNCDDSEWRHEIFQRMK
jgi:hypothetical protein